MFFIEYSYVESRRLYGQEKRHLISPFVREIPPELLQAVRLSNTVNRPVNFRRRHSSTLMNKNDSGLTLGQRVCHSTFGEGTILDMEGQGTHARVQVNFDEAGSKWLVLSYANLKAG